MWLSTMSPAAFEPSVPVNLMVIAAVSVSVPVRLT
jgi:hypothetical protein